MTYEFTAEEWFTLLDPGIRDKAITAHKAYGSYEGRTYRSLAAAINGSFIWAKTPEGHRFWAKMHAKAALETRKPATNRGMIDCTIREGE